MVSIAKGCPVHQHPLGVHLPQQTPSLIRRPHELPCIHLLPAWHADCDPLQRLALQRDVLRIRHSQSPSAAADGFSHCSSSELSYIYFMPAWHADHDPPQRSASQEDVLHIRPPLRDFICRSRQLSFSISVVCKL